MKTTWENLVHYVRTIHVHDIRNKLLNKNTVIITKTEHTQDASDEHNLDTERRDQLYKRLNKARHSQKEVFGDQVIVVEPNIASKSKMSLAIINNKIVEAKYKIQCILPIVLEGDVKVENENEWRTYCVRKSQLEKQRTHALYII